MHYRTRLDWDDHARRKGDRQTMKPEKIDLRRCVDGGWLILTRSPHVHAAAFKRFGFTLYLGGWTIPAKLLGADRKLLDAEARAYIERYFGNAGRGA